MGAIEKIKDNISKVGFLMVGFTEYTGDDDLIKLYSKYIEASNTDIKIVAGEFGHVVFNSDPVIESLMRAIERGLYIELVGGGPIDPASERLWELVKERKIQYYKLEKRPSSHFAVFDSHHIRVEYYHPANSNNRAGYFSKNAINLANEFSQYFEEMKEDAILDTNPTT